MLFCFFTVSVKFMAAGRHFLAFFENWLHSAVRLNSQNWLCPTHPSCCTWTCVGAIFYSMWAAQTEVLPAAGIKTKWILCESEIEQKLPKAQDTGAKPRSVHSTSSYISILHKTCKLPLFGLIEELRVVRCRDAVIFRNAKKHQGLGFRDKNQIRREVEGFYNNGPHRRISSAQRNHWSTCKGRKGPRLTH